MGNLHSSIRLMGRETRDEEEGGATSSALSPRQKKSDCHDTIPNDRGILRFPGLIYIKAIKGLFRFIVSIPRCWPRKTNSEGPILPIQNPCAAPISAGGNDYDPVLLVQPLLYSYFHECDDDFIEGDTSSEDKTISVPESVTSESKEIMCLPAVLIMQEEEEVEEKTMIKSSVEGVRWIKHYSNRHRILLVGDGDFSFSASLAVAFGRASNMIATSLDSKAFLKKNYGNAHFNITELRKRECKVMHGIDATKVAGHLVLGQLKFDRIIYNFPFAGFFKNMARETQLKRHRRLVSLFLKNAREMLSEDGEIHISHKTNGFHVEWKLVSIASSHRLRLIEAVDFHQEDYPGYNTKCGFGGDNNFSCNPSKTYKFGFKTLCF